MTIEEMTAQVMDDCAVHATGIDDFLLTKLAELQLRIIELEKLVQI